MEDSHRAMASEVDRLRAMNCGLQTWALQMNGAAAQMGRDGAGLLQDLTSLRANMLSGAAKLSKKLLAEVDARVQAAAEEVCSSMNSQATLSSVFSLAGCAHLFAQLLLRT